MKPECDTRLKLLTAATDLMWESSYGSVSVDDICLRAGVRKGSFYYFFPSKCDLTIAAITRMWENSKPIHDQVFSSQVPPLERFAKHCEMILQVQQTKLINYGKVCGCPYFTLGSEMSTQDEKIRLKIEGIAGCYRLYYETALCELIQDGLTCATDPAVKAQEILAFLSGSLLQAKVTNSLEPLQNLAEGVGLLIGVQLKKGTESLVLAC